MLCQVSFTSGAKPESIFSIFLNSIFPNFWTLIAECTQKEGLTELIRLNFTGVLKLLMEKYHLSGDYMKPMQAKFSSPIQLKLTDFF